MLGRVENGGGDAPNGVEKPKSKGAGTIEKTYQKVSQLEHILLRPDTYIGSIERVSETMWIYDKEKETMLQKNITYVPGLYKIFDEILVNAADNKQRDPKMDCIKIEIDSEENVISVYNNGRGIPVVMHKDENMFVPTMIFGHLLTSSNYNDEEEKVTGGRNGYGAKLCNIFSTKFTVETASKQYKKQFKQSWGSNMTKASEPKIKEFHGEDFTKVTFSPDLGKFKMEKLDDDLVGLLSRRAFDVAASSRGVKVFLNKVRVPVKNFKDYIDLYIKGEDDDGDGVPVKLTHEVVSDRWEIGVCLSSRGFQQVSFVNSIATMKGGRHVDYITDLIVKQIIEVVKKKNKGGVSIKPFQVKNHLWVFINCLIVNPTFDSQTKENMTLQMKNFGSKCALSDKFISSAVKSGIVESVLTWAKFKAQTVLNKAGGKKQSKLKGVPKLEDANEAGTKNALRCTLILTEGDSAKSLAVSGLGVIGRDYYGVFPLRGKLLNVREATHKQILENAEINALVKIIGLQYKKKYNSEEDMKTLRYGKVMIMTDQDQDGSHIKGLIINFIHFNWPELLKQNFLEEFITPIVKATKRNEQLSFYSLPELEEWKTNTPNHHTYSLKYYKGLGTSTSKEAKEYFTDMVRHRIRFRYNGTVDDDHIVLAFSKKHVEHRKEWLTNFMVETKRRKEMGLPENYLYTKDTRFVSYANFVNLELVLFSYGDNVRSLPCMVDGFKPGQRKVLFTCLKRNDKKEVKVAQLAGSVAEQSAYHHGEVSLCMTIVNLAQNFVGSNNINLLEPRGQFGTRLVGGKDSASPRYIFTKMSPMTKMIFHPNDEPILKSEYDDGKKIEPTWYIPVIPMVLVNGADGIGTGWMTKIPNYNPREIVSNLRKLLNDEEMTPMLPWYKNFRGTIDELGDGRYLISGEISIIGHDKLEITELPISTWTQNYKENILEPLLHGSDKVKSIISDYKEYNTDTTVKFIVSCLPSEMTNLEHDGFHKAFKLQTTMSVTSMCCFDELGCLRKMDSALDIMKEFYTLRLRMYRKRKDFLEGQLKADADKLTNQARFIMEKCSGELTVENKKRKTITDELVRRGYDPDPVLAWKKRSKLEEDDEPEENLSQDDEEQQEDAPAAKKPADPEKEFKEASDVKKFDYLLGMSMWMLTDEKKNELLRQKNQKLSELEILKKKTPSDLWLEDLDAFSVKLDEVEEKERADENVAIKKEKKGPGSKKQTNLRETLPSTTSQRIEPSMRDDLKKKIPKGTRKVKKENTNEMEEDEFDTMTKGTKTLKDKLGTPESAEKKGRSKKPKDGMKQTKLNFAKKSPNKNSKANGKKAKKTSDSEDEMSLSDTSDVDFSVNVGPAKDRSAARRNIAKPIKYVDSDSDKSMKSDHEDVLFDNEAVLNSSTNSQEVLHDSDSEPEAPPPPVMESSDQMFDSLIGKSEPEPKKPAPAKRKRAPKERNSDSDAPRPSKSDSDDEGVAKKSKPKKKKRVVDSDSDSDFEEEKPKGKPRKKKAAVLSDDDFVDASDDDFKPKAKSGRAKKPTKSSRGKGLGPTRLDLLSRVEEKELKIIKVAIRRHDVPHTNHLAPLKKRLENPELLKVHFDSVPGRKIFWRDDVIPNLHDPCEEEGAVQWPFPRHRKGEEEDRKPPIIKKNLKPAFDGYKNTPPSYPLPPEADEPERSKRRESRNKQDDVYPSTSKEYDSHRTSGDRRTYYKSPERRRSRSISPTRRRSRGRTNSPRQRSPPCRDRRSPPKRPGLYIPPKKKRRSRSASPEAQLSRRSAERRTHSDDYHRKSYRRASKSRSPPHRSSRTPPRSSRHEDTRLVRSRSSHSRARSLRDEPHRSRRSRTPLRPGEYVPNRRRSPPYERRVSRSPSSKAGEFKPRKPHFPYDHPTDFHRPHPYDVVGPAPGYFNYYEPGWNNPYLRAPFPGQWPTGPSPYFPMMPNPYLPRVRPTVIRPPIQYNNRTIPTLSSTSAPTTTTTGTSSQAVVTSSQTKDDNQPAKNGKKPEDDQS